MADYTSWQHLRSEQGEEVQVFHSGGIMTATREHARFDAILRGLKAGEDVLPLFANLGHQFVGEVEKFTDRVSVSKKGVMLDGEELDDSLARKIVEVYRQNLPVLPLVKFLLKIIDNPSFRSRQQTFDFLMENDAQIFADGDMLLWKGLGYDGRSRWRGTAKVDGRLYRNQRIPNHLGTTVSMKRSEISDDPSRTCDVGLHVATYERAKRFSQTTGIVRAAKINPAHVVSVPLESNRDKIRVWKYRLVKLPDDHDFSSLYVEKFRAS